MLTPNQAPPDDYYQTNCRVLIEFVLREYADVLDATATGLLRRFTMLTDGQQRLIARLLTRKGPLIRADSLNYAEIEDIPSCVQELAQGRFITLNPPAPADQMLNILRKAEVAQAFPHCAEKPQKLRKPELVERILANKSDRQIYCVLTQRHDWLSLSTPVVWQLVKLLYFGDAEHDWSAFVLRDLGVMRYESLPLSNKRFANHTALALDLNMRRLSQLSHRLEEHPQLACELRATLQPASQDRFIEHRRRRALLRIGQWHERRAEPDAAVAAYQYVPEHPARERIVRVLHKAGRQEQAQGWLEKIRRAPVSEEEQQFAERFGKRAAGYQPPQDTLYIESARQDVEQQALELVVKPGQWGAHVENSLLKSLTGLVYWPIIFADVPGAFHNPFQSAPRDLYRGDFCEPRETLINQIETRTIDDTALIAHIEQVAERKAGIANALVNWTMLEHVGLPNILYAMPTDHIRTLSAFLIRHLRTHRRGLPDLFIARGKGDYELVEVKGPTDQLQPGQRVWMKQFASMQIPARILKLKLRP